MCCTLYWVLVASFLLAGVNRRCYSGLVDEGSELMTAPMCWSIFQLAANDMRGTTRVNIMAVANQKTEANKKTERAENYRWQRVAGGNICYVLISSVTVIVTGLVTTRWLFSALNNVQEDVMSLTLLTTHVSCSLHSRLQSFSRDYVKLWRQYFVHVHICI